MRDLLVALAGVALAATPASAQFSYVPSGTTIELRGLSLAGDWDLRNGREVRGSAWTSGARGTVLRSVDLGDTWRVDTVPGAGGLDLRAIHGFSAAAAIVASAGEAEKGLAKIFATRGAGWREVYSTDLKGVFFDAIAFWDDTHGIALSDPLDSAFFLLTTTDGGQSWTRIPPARLPRVLPGEAAFAASGSSLVVLGSHVWIGTGGGGRARVMHSGDRGLTWEVRDTPVHAAGGAAGIFSLAFFDERTGVAAGGDYTRPRLAATSIALTADGGRTWRAAAAPPAAYLSGVSFAGSTNDLVAVGLAGTFASRDGGETWTQTDTLPLNSVRFRGRIGIAVGPRGRIGHQGLLRR